METSLKGILYPRNATTGQVEIKDHIKTWKNRPPMNNTRFYVLLEQYNITLPFKIEINIYIQQVGKENEVSERAFCHRKNRVSLYKKSRNINFWLRMR